jgi:hypothetical protein
MHGDEPRPPTRLNAYEDGHLRPWKVLGHCTVCYRPVRESDSRFRVGGKVGVYMHWLCALRGRPAVG